MSLSTSVYSSSDTAQVGSWIGDLWCCWVGINNCGLVLYKQASLCI